MPLLAAAILAAAILALGGCGDDDGPSDPAPDRTIEFPGDAATLQAAIEMAVAGDTVRVGDGTHLIDSTIVFRSASAGVTLIGRAENEIDTALRDRPVLEFTRVPRGDGIVVAGGVPDVTIRGLTLRGSMSVGVGLLGPRGLLADCVVDRAASYAVSCTQEGSDGTIEENLLLDAGLFAVYCLGGAPPLVRANTIVGAGDCGIYSLNSAPTCRSNVIFGSVRWGVFCQGDPVPQLDCNVLFENGSADYSCASGDTLHFDPLFCDAATFAIRADSPCAPENSGGCGLIGAVGVGCAP